MTDTPRCTHCKGPLPAKGQRLTLERRRDGFVGQYCEREACQEAWNQAAMDDGRGN